MTPVVTSLPGAAALGGWIIAAVAGFVGGRLLVAGVRRLVDPPRAIDMALARWLPVVAAAGGLALWWWEAVGLGLEPEGVVASTRVAAVRGGLHGVLFLLLAAASWVDLRHRVIPDAITVPGVLAGLAAFAAWPAALLPVAREVPRSFAPPLREADVLGLAGPLRSAWPEWLEPTPLGLAVAAAIFAGWWLVGTDSGVAAEPPARWRDRLAGPRSLAGIAGAAVIAAAWLSGGDHWRGLVSSLGGLAVAAGIVWLTRIGASRALGREAMGFGDVTLMAMIGAWLGWQACVLSCFLAVFIGLGHGVAQLLRHREAELPFGPSLCLGAAVVVLAWQRIWSRAEAVFERPLELAAVVVAVIALTAITLWTWQRIRSISGA